MCMTVSTELKLLRSFTERNSNLAVYKIFSGAIDLPPFYSAGVARLESSSFQTSSGSYSVPSKKRRPFQYESSNIGTGSPLLLFPPHPSIHSSTNLTRRAKNSLRRSCDLPSIYRLPLPTPNYGIPIYAIPPPNSLSFKIVLFFK